MGEQIREALRAARDLVAEEPEDLRPTAYGIVLDYLLGVPAAPAPVGVTRAPASFPDATVLDVAAYLARFVITGHPLRIAAVALFYAEHGHDGVTTDTLRAAYREAGIEEPHNWADAIGASVRAGILALTDTQRGRRSWRVTEHGRAVLRELVRFA